MHSINLSRAKAYTAVSLKASSRSAHELINDLGIDIFYWAGGCETGFKGGIPVYDKKNAQTAIGAIGVSGGTQEEDEEISLFGLKAMHFITK